MIEEILKNIEDEKNIFITGGAGTGKSYTLNKVIDYLDRHHSKKIVAKTAMTGMASLQFEGGGQTLHSLTGIGVYKNIDDLKHIVNKYFFKTEKRYLLQEIDILIVDEISMLRSDTLELIDALFKYVMQSTKPFGGKQVIFCGDFMQLPPIVKAEDRLENFWAFQSPVWSALDFKVIYLTEVKRQDSKTFSNALNMIRAGVVNDSVDQFFFKSVKNKIPDDVESVKLLSTNEAVNTFNREKLNRVSVESEEKTFMAKVWGMDEKLESTIRRDSPAVERLQLRPGCQVMILVNSPTSGYVNGSMGEFLEHNFIYDIEDNKIPVLVIRLFEDDRVVKVPMYQWTIKIPQGEADLVLAYFNQYPVKLAYAITIHKSQGMSIDYLEVDLKKCFADHMAYVALSRAKNYEGLRVINWEPRAVKCNKAAFNFYMGLKKSGVI